ncbi:unnamed protein product [Schistosoma curassoni]|uniref:Transposase n=1 Tax=Schistosoma curassoni TaxID=6186 RepID=A0A183KHG5_9TREM|nr:unnamed protein product [Schistosoma curassoni]
MNDRWHKILNSAQNTSRFPDIDKLPTWQITCTYDVVVGGSLWETLNPGFVLFGTHKQGNLQGTDAP